MRAVSYILIIFFALSFSACSKFGKGGSGSSSDLMGEGNIPFASPGSELADINFAFDSSELNETAQAVLSQNSKWIMDNPSRRIEVEGHCDERGTAEYNMALGERRARSVYNYLRGIGVKEDRISTISYGEELPLDPQSNETAWSKNRRAHFAIK